MDESSRTPETSGSAYRGEGPQTFYLGYQRAGKWQWRKLTAGTGDEDIRAVFFVKPGGKDWPAIPEKPENANTVAGFKRDKPPATSLEETGQAEGVTPTDAAAITQSVCYWVDGKLICDDDNS